jgi:hypothetical protein
MARMLWGIALLLAGCAIPAGHYRGCHRCGCPDGVDAILGGAEAIVGMGALAYDVSAAIGDRTQRSWRPPPALIPRPFVGTVRVSDSSAALALTTVVLQGASGLVELRATTDRGGHFYFPLPLPADWYTVSVDDDAFEGGRRVWLKERRPVDFVILAQPKPERLPPD